jgi:hypothetical protein
MTDWPPLPPLLLQFRPPPPSPTPRARSPSPSSRPTISISSGSPSARGTDVGCIDNNISYNYGDLMGYVGSVCENSTAIHSKQAYLCGLGGDLVLMQYTERRVFPCPKYTTYCHQCGKDKAFCFAESTTAEVAAAHPDCAAGSNSSTIVASSSPSTPLAAPPTSKEPTIATARPITMKPTTSKPVTPYPTILSTALTTSTAIPTSSHSATHTPLPTPTQMQCVFGNNIFQVGDSIGKLGHHCTSGKQYLGAEFFCADYGVIQIKEQNFTCSTNSLSECYQCREKEAFCLSPSVATNIPQGECVINGNYSNRLYSYPQWMEIIQGSTMGINALNYSGYCGILSADGSSGICDPKSIKCANDSDCSSNNGQYNMCMSACNPTTSIDVPPLNGTYYTQGDDDLDDDQSWSYYKTSNGSEDATVSGCVFGGSQGNTSSVRWKPGYAIGYIGFACLSNSTFLGDASYCGADGSLFSVSHTQLSCPEQAPYCFQCGEVTSPGSAVCSSRRFIHPENCIPGEYIWTDLSTNDQGTNSAEKFYSAVDFSRNHYNFILTLFLASYFGVIIMFQG